MAWCETVEYGKGPCVGCANKAVDEVIDSEKSSDAIVVEKKFDEGEIKDEVNDNDSSDDCDDEKVDSSDYFEKAKELGILDACYDGPQSPLEAASIITSHKQPNDTFGWRSGGVSVQYQYSERGGLINKCGYSRFLLDRVNPDGSIMVRYACSHPNFFTSYFLNFSSKIYSDTLFFMGFVIIQKLGLVLLDWLTATANYCRIFL